MEAELAAFIASESNRPFDWRRTNCGFLADRWMTGVLGYSPLRRCAFILGDEAEWDGLRIAVTINRVMRECGIPKTTEPEPGDVGLIVHGEVRRKLCIAIRTPTIWFSRDHGGLIGAPLSAVWKAWKVV